MSDEAIKAGDRVTWVERPSWAAFGDVRTRAGIVFELMPGKCAFVDVLGEPWRMLTFTRVKRLTRREPFGRAQPAAGEQGA